MGTSTAPTVGEQLGSSVSVSAVSHELATPLGPEDESDEDEFELVQLSDAERLSSTAVGVVETRFGLESECFCLSDGLDGLETLAVVGGQREDILSRV